MSHIYRVISEVKEIAKCTLKKAIHFKKTQHNFKLIRKETLVRILKLVKLVFQRRIKICILIKGFHKKNKS